MCNFEEWMGGGVKEAKGFTSSEMEEANAYLLAISIV